MADNHPAAPPCPVCRGLPVIAFQTVKDRDYWRCQACQATFLEPDQRPDVAAERAEYDLHENSPGDRHYRRFLNRLAGPLLQRLAPGRLGLDYGCGPGPALAAMLREAGHRVALWDPLYAIRPQTLERQYDFVTCTEVVEHMHAPAEDFDRIDALLRPGGWFGVLTRFQTDDSRFANWHYRRDPTHVVFYREVTFTRLAAARGWDLHVPEPDVVLMQKRAPAGTGGPL